MSRGFVLVVGPIPPPLHGMAVVTSRIVDHVRERGDAGVEVVDTSTGRLQRGIRYHAAKMAAIGRGILALVRFCREPRRTLYMPADAETGMWYTTALACTGRILGYRLVIHHHSMAYLRERCFRAVVLTRCAGRAAVHVNICPVTVDLFRELYGTDLVCLPLNNSFTVEQADPPVRRAGDRIVLGHFGNLSMEKGIGTVLGAFCGVLDRGLPVRLVLAGPPVSEQVRQLIDASVEELGESCEYRGRIDTGGKRRFFRDIDVFLFPSQYINEIQGIVNLEAMSNGAIPMAFSHGCIPTDFMEGGGVAVDPESDYQHRLIEQIELWVRDRHRLRDDRMAAHGRFSALKSQGVEELERVLAVLTGSDL